MEWDSFTFDWNLDAASLVPNLVAVEAHKQTVLNLILPPHWHDRLDPAQPDTRRPRNHGARRQSSFRG